MLLTPASQPAGADDLSSEADRFSPWARADGFRLGG
jgi:hypothetical protein